MTQADQPELLWTPSKERIDRSALTAYARAVGREGEYADLWQWSVDDLEGFWASIWDHFDVQAAEPYERVLGDRSMPGAEWFPGSRLSYAEHLFRGKDDDAVAVRHASELRDAGELTWGQLRDLTARIAAGLRRLGVAEGDRVVAYVPNIPEAVAAFAACASIGATWSRACRPRCRASSTPCCCPTWAPASSTARRPGTS